MRVLITGITGLVGSYLTGFILDNIPSAEIFGTRRWRSRMDHIKSMEARVTLMDSDIRDGVSVRSLIRDVKPDIIFHMASQSSVFTSWHAPRETLVTNIIGQIDLFEAVREYIPQCQILVPCSSEEYGIVDENSLPITEDVPFHPLSPYAVSKVIQDVSAYQYEKSYALKIYIARSFNHTAPGRDPCYVESDFARQIALIEKGKQEPVIYAGNLDSARDYTDVRDIVRAYWLMVHRCPTGVAFNICSGKVITIREMLDILLSMTDAKPEIRMEESRLRPMDAPIIQGDSSRFRQMTGWQPEIPIESTLRDILDFWRGMV